MNVIVHTAGCGDNHPSCGKRMTARDLTRNWVNRHSPLLPGEVACQSCEGEVIQMEAHLKKILGLPPNEFLN